MKLKILLLLLLTGAFYSAVKANEVEPNDTRAQANTLPLNGSNSGTIGTATDVDWYKVTTNAEGQINLTLAISNGLNAYFALYDNDGVTLLHQDYTAGTFSYSYDGLAVGTYYVKIFPYFTGQLPAYTLSNTLTVAALTNDVEPDSTRAQAIAIPLNGGKTGHIDYYYNHHRDSLDMYKVTTNADGALKLVLTSANGQNVYFQLYDNDATTLLHSDYTAGSFNYTVDGLAAGTYYIKIFTYYNTGFASYTISDTLIKPTQANDVEPDSTRAQAILLPLDGSKTGHIDYYYNHHRDSLDVYQVTTTADGALRLSMSSGNGQNVYFQLYDNDEKTLLHSDYTAGNFSYTFDGLAAGTYYIKIFTYYNTGFAPYTISDSLFIPSIANDAEPDSTKATALILPLNGSVKGHVGYYYNNHRDTVDEYKLTTTADGNINLNITSANNSNIWFSLYDNNGTTLIHQDYTAGNFSYNADGLAKGTYYIKVFCYYNGQFTPYTLKDSLTTYNANDAEPNKYAKQAKTMNTNLSNSGHVDFYYDNVRDTVDWAKINYTGAGAMSVTLNVIPNITGPQQNTWMQIYKDTTAAPLYNSYTTTTETANLTGLAEGYYYVKIFEYYNGQFTAYTVTPTFTQSDFAKVKIESKDTLANCSDTSSLVVKPSGSHSPYTLQLYRFGTAYGNPVTATNGNVTFSGLPEGSYSVRAFGDGATGTAYGKTANLGFEPMPTGLSTTTIKATSAKLNWDTLACVKYFVIQYEVHGSGNWLTKKPAGNVDNYILKGLTAATTYDWRVASDDSANKIVAQSKYADSITFTTAASLIADNNSNDDNLSINSNKNIGVITVAPNPATSYFTIHYNTLTQQRLIATLFDMNGKSVWSSGAINADALNGKKVMVSQFGSGLYYLKISNDKGEVVGDAKVSIIR